MGAPSQMTSSLPGQVGQQVPQEAHHVRAAQGAVGRHLEQQLAVRGDAADDREVIAGEAHAQDRRLAAGGVGPHAAGQQIEAGFVYPDDGAPFGGRPFLSAGQRSAYQRAMAASSRWVAR